MKVRAAVLDASVGSKIGAMIGWCCEIGQMDGLDELQVCAISTERAHCRHQLKSVTIGGKRKFGR